MFIILKTISVTVSIKGKGHYPAEIRLYDQLGTRIKGKQNTEPTKY